MQLDHHLARMSPAPTVHHGVDPDAGVEYLVTDWHDGLPMQIARRPLDADGWTAWSAPVALAEVLEARP